MSAEILDNKVKLVKSLERASVVKRLCFGKANRNVSFKQ